MASAKYVKLNNECIQPDPIADEPDRGRGQTVFPGSRFPNVFLVGPKRAGKSCIIEHIFKKYFTGLSEKEREKLQILVFCPNAFKDARWKSILAWCKKQKLNVKVRRSMLMTDEECKKAMAGKPPYRGTDFLDWFVHLLRYDKDPEKPEDRYVYHVFMDDMTHATRSKPMSELASTNRNKYAMVVTGSQEVHYLNKDAREQQDFVMAGRGIPDADLHVIHREMSLPMAVEDFIEVYHDVTADPKEKNFLHINRETGNLRLNFDTAIVLPESDPALREVPSSNGKRAAATQGNQSQKRHRSNDYFSAPPGGADFEDFEDGDYETDTRGQHGGNDFF